MIIVFFDWLSRQGLDEYWRFFWVVVVYFLLFLRYPILLHRTWCFFLVELDI
jgi:hypothetical protein